MIYQNYDALVDYSKQEIASCRQDLDQIYIRANDEDSWTALDVYTYQKQYQIASTVLYDILQEKNWKILHWKAQETVIQFLEKI